MQRITSLFGVALVGASISIGALVASGIGTESQHNTVAVNAAATTIGNAQPGVVVRASAVAPVTTTSLSIQPGVSQPDPAAPSVAARPASTTGLGMAQPGVDLRAPTVTPVQTTASLSIQPGLPRPDAQSEHLPPLFIPYC